MQQDCCHTWNLIAMFPDQILLGLGRAIFGLRMRLGMVASMVDLSGYDNHNAYIVVKKKRSHDTIHPPLFLNEAKCTRELP